MIIVADKKLEYSCDECGVITDYPLVNNMCEECYREYLEEQKMEDTNSTYCDSCYKYHCDNVKLYEGTPLCEDCRDDLVVSKFSNSSMNYHVLNKSIGDDEFNRWLYNQARANWQCAEIKAYGDAKHKPTTEEKADVKFYRYLMSILNCLGGYEDARYPI